MKTKLTYSRLSTRRMCPRKDYYQYELCIRREEVATPLRMGKAFAIGKELWRKNHTDAVDEACMLYDDVPHWADPYEWEIECETVRNLLLGYIWRYKNDDMEFIAVEQEFTMPLVNPATGGTSQTFVLAGKIDGIVQLPDNRVAVYEDKTTSADITDGSDYWLQRRYDGQISQYVVGARYLGHNISTVIYDVTRKPTIKPKSIPLLDVAGDKVVLDANNNRILNANGKPRQTGSTKDGYVLQTRPETPKKWGKRLLDDITERPDWYFARHEIPRLEADLEEFQSEVWQQGKLLLESRNHGWWFRNVSPMTCKYCEYANPCLGGVDINLEHVPSGYEIIEKVNPELSE